MRKILFVLLTLVSLWACNRKEPYPKKLLSEANEQFQIIDSLCRSIPQGILNFELYAPILLIDPETRYVFGNESGDSLEKIGGIYAGSYTSKHIAINGPGNWNGKKWNILMLPLPDERAEKERLIIKSLFSFHEDQIGFNQLHTPYCQHLNERINRIWMKIEASALEQALNESDLAIQREHLRMALAARKMRKISTGDYFIREQQHDLKFGFPELLYFTLKDQKSAEIKNELLASLNSLQASDHFMNAFATVIFPAYGYLMNQQSKQWMQTVNSQTDIIQLIQNFYQFTYPEDFDGIMQMLNTKYDREKFEKTEDQREARLLDLAAKYHQQFIDVPFVMIRLNNQTAIEYLSDQMIPFEGKGFIIPAIKAYGPWGKLTATNGVLINNEYSYLYISEPVSIEGSSARGDSWQIELNAGYGIYPYPGTDKFIVNRNPSQ